ncbi:hypothetical protein ACFY3G_17785 [Streptomyces phaeochromogenes]|uniref:hypothetical protein n=1 Tax=Streptomyces phaeochromogenes TaxID=1923 RepID=UPI0036A96E00
MDEGLAALIAGVAGAIGGIGGGTAGAFFTGRAMVRQVRDQATTEHGHWLREQRMQAYLTLLREWDAAHQGLKGIWTRALEAYADDSNHILQGDLGEIRNAMLDQVEQIVAPTGMAFERVAMLGPGQVDDAALGLEMALQELRAVVESRLAPNDLTTTQALNWEPWNDTDHAASRARQIFVECVRGVLGEPPTPASNPD